jgi:GxxExxY protein
MINRIHTDKKLIYADLTYKIRGCIFDVYNELGHGHKEQVYQKALAKELEEKEIPFKREVNLKVKYKGESVGNYRPDFLIEEKVMVEIKAVEFMPKSYEEQLIHYLKSTEIKLGLLVNFGRPKLEIKRLVWTLEHLRKSAINPRESKLI